MQHNDAGMPNNAQQPNSVPSPNAGQYAPYVPGDTQQAGQVPPTQGYQPSNPQGYQQGYPQAYAQQPGAYAPVEVVPRKPNRVTAYITAGIVVLLSAIVIAVGFSMFSQEVTITYPQADNCGSVMQPASLSEGGNFDVGMREKACEQALSSKTGEAFIPIGIGVALIALMSWTAFSVTRQHKKWQEQYGRR
ncbi:hypothetical protein EG850_05800 [Gulosibacter macacae]|uniref:Transmembrane protein n=1 Tax=Gulosibacter macacae TaxID=2488791 RepID=A0A3P3W0B1_9MICO|nr:hypothetical protein [Gulosibacter macacae]RRJ87316.1 hypothetical protein EG850_05800 [Gulosibacter macacae]